MISPPTTVDPSVPHTLAIYINDALSKVFFFVDGVQVQSSTTVPTLATNMAPFAATYNTTTGTGNNRQVKLCSLVTSADY